MAPRLNPQGLSATLAKSLMLLSEGHTQSAQRGRDTAMNMPVGVNGRTIAQAMAAYDMSPEKTPV